MATYSNSEPIVIRQRRDFGEIFGSPFNFLRQEFKLFMKTMLRYAGPFFGIGLLGMMVFTESGSSYGGYSDDIFGSLGAGYLVFMFFYYISVFVLALLTNAYLSLYANLGKDNFTQKDVWIKAKQYIGTYIGLGILVALMVMAGFMFLIIPGIALAIYLSFVFIAAVHENLGAGAAISRSFAVTKDNWWKTFAMLLVFGMLVGFASNIVMLPFTLVLGATASGESFSAIALVLTTALSFGVYFLLAALQQILVGFMYFSYTSQSQGINLSNKIDAIFQTETKQTEPEIVTQPKNKTRVEDYYPELGGVTPSWSSDEPVKNIPEKPEEDKIVETKTDEPVRYEPPKAEEKPAEKPPVVPPNEEPKTDDKKWIDHRRERRETDEDNRFKRKDDSDSNRYKKDDDIDRFRPKH